MKNRQVTIVFNNYYGSMGNSYDPVAVYLNHIKAVDYVTAKNAELREKKRHEEDYSWTQVELIED